MWKVIHRLASIHFYGLSLKAASYRSWSCRLLVRVSVHSERGAEIPYIYRLGSRLEFSATQTHAPPTLPPFFLFFSSLTTAPCPKTSPRPSVLFSLVGVSPGCTSSSHLTSFAGDETHRWTDSPVLYVHKFRCISGSIKGTKFP